jgi:hypothetical protein
METRAGCLRRSHYFADLQDNKDRTQQKMARPIPKTVRTDEHLNRDGRCLSGPQESGDDAETTRAAKLDTAGEPIDRRGPTAGQDVGGQAEPHPVAGSDDLARGGRAIISGIRRASDADSGEPGTGRVFASKGLIEKQATVLKAWALENGLMCDGAAFFHRWISRGAVEGAEHVVVRGNDRVFKAYTGLLSTKRGYEEYFDRILMHAHLFPDTAIRLEGFIEDAKGRLLPLISQRMVTAQRGANIEEVAAHMKARGFERVGESYGFTDGRLIVDDLHGENVLVRDDGNFAVIDPILKVADGMQMEEV